MHIDMFQWNKCMLNAADYDKSIIIVIINVISYIKFISMRIIICNYNNLWHN